MTITPDPVEIATRAWLMAWRKEWVVRYPHAGDCPVPVFDAVPMADRMRMMRCVEAALKAADPQNIERVYAQG